MKEIDQILIQYHKAVDAKLKSALATVVMVNGSAYRRPGARMLILENGEFTGAISGGCLEGDALKKAQLVIFQQKSMLVTYDTTDEDDQKFGVGLGCNGIIQILMEPIDYNNPLNAIELLRKAYLQPDLYFLTTFFSTKNALEEQIGSRLTSYTFEFEPILADNLYKAFLENKPNPSVLGSNFKIINHLSDNSFVFIEQFHQKKRIVIFGAGNDVKPLTKLLAILGYHTVLIDGRPNYANYERFPEVNEIIVSAAIEVQEKFHFGANDFVLLMTHNFEYEATILNHIINFNLHYIGILGPKKKTNKLLERLGLPIDEKFIKSKNIFGPIGLDLGAETSEEISVAIVSEILAVIHQKLPSFLRDKNGPIHTV